MADLRIDLSGLGELTKSMMELPGLFARARRSALSSVAFMVRGEVRNHIEYGGTGWPRLHPITPRFRKYKSAPGTPVYYLGRFARYKIDAHATKADIGLGRQFPGDNKWIEAAAIRHEQGQTVTVTKAMRRLWLTTKSSKTMHGQVGTDWFSLSPKTKAIRIPARPTIQPVFNKVRGKIPPHFEFQFHAALERYRRGRDKSTSSFWRS